LLLLLAFRVVIAPLTYRPAAADPHHRYNLVLRTRWWPPQRLQRFSRTSKLLQLFQGKSRLASEAEGKRAGLLALWPSPRSCLGAVVLCVSHALPAGPLTTVLRC
jgi:hypothetical protein